MARTKNNRSGLSYKMSGFPKHQTKSHLNQNHEEPDWESLNINATSKNPNIPDTSHIVPKMSEEMKKFKEQYPDLYEARYGSGDVNLKARLQSVQHGYDKIAPYDITGVSNVLGTTAGIIEGTKGGKDLLKSATNIASGKIKTGKKLFDHVLGGLDKAKTLYKVYEKSKG
jgi:hypothetical protein